MAKKPLLVPIRLRQGGIMHDTDYMRGANSLEEAKSINDELAEQGNSRYGVSYFWGIVEPFEATLHVLEAQRHGSAAYMLLEDDLGQSWPMFLGDLADLLYGANMTNGWTEHKTFEVCKKGTAYGIRMVK